MTHTQLSYDKQEMAWKNYFFNLFLIIRALVDGSSSFHYRKSRSLEAIPHCNRDNIYHGTWHYDRYMLVDQSPYHACPKTRERILSMPKLKNQVTHYDCLNRIYHHAEYIPHASTTSIDEKNETSSSLLTCYIRPIESSLRLLYKRKLKIYFIGDSLMGQLYIAFLCNSEIYGYFDKISSQFIGDVFLRPDIPCDPRCRIDKDFLESENAKGIHHLCAGCPEGIYHELNQSYPYISQFWPSMIRNDATHVVIGTGSWYAGSRKLLSSEEEYNRTLATIKPILVNFSKAPYHMSISWLDLPPMVYTPPPYEDLFGWNYFFTFNTFAKEAFQDTPIRYLDTSRATRSRKMTDRNITDDFHHHWCNPGHNMIPTFQIRTYLHLITENK